eukprot:COSAG02_NODE_7_length_64539_cov_120.393482_10_plen_463_part_00
MLYAAVNAPRARARARARVDTAIARLRVRHVRGGPFRKGNARSSQYLSALFLQLRAHRRMESPSARVSTGSESSSYRESVANLRRALDERQAPLLSNASRGSWVQFLEGCITQFNALLTAAICYVAAIAWLQVTYGEIGLLNRKPSSGNSTIASESRPLVGADLYSFFFALLFVTAACFYGVYKLQKIKHRAVAAELERISALMQSDQTSTGSGSACDGSTRDMLQAQIPAFSKISEPLAHDPGSGSVDMENALMYRELVVCKFRAEGMQTGTNMITDAWTFANMKMMTIFMRSCFISADKDYPGDEELGWVRSRPPCNLCAEGLTHCCCAVRFPKVWIYTGSLFLACVVLVSAAWEYPPRFIASSKKGFSTDRRARVELVAKNWSGGCAWLLAMQCAETFEFTLAHLVLGQGHWHPWGNPAVSLISLRANAKFCSCNLTRFVDRMLVISRGLTLGTAEGLL